MGSHATTTVSPDAARVPSGSLTSWRSRKLDVPTGDVDDDLDLFVILARLGVVIEIDVAST